MWGNSEPLTSLFKLNYLETPKPVSMCPTSLSFVIMNEWSREVLTFLLKRGKKKWLLRRICAVAYFFISILMQQWEWEGGGGLVTHKWGGKKVHEQSGCLSVCCMLHTSSGSLPSWWEPEAKLMSQQPANTLFLILSFSLSRFLSHFRSACPLYSSHDWKLNFCNIAPGAEVTIWAWPIKSLIVQQLADRC